MSALVSSATQAASSALPAAVWRASQMASGRTAMTPTGFAALDAELPDGGWPAAMLIELLLRQPGIGEMRLLRPALREATRRGRIALVQPPHPPQIAAWTTWGLPPERLLWLKPRTGADALWAAEQVLRNGSCAALILWQTQTRTEALRRLHLAAQGAETLFWMMRPLNCAQDPSPAPLRLALRPAHGGIEVGILKRRGPHCAQALHLVLDDTPASLATDSHHAHLDRHPSAAAAARSHPAELV